MVVLQVCKITQDCNTEKILCVHDEERIMVSEYKKSKNKGETI